MRVTSLEGETGRAPGDLEEFTLPPFFTDRLEGEEMLGGGEKLLRVSWLLRMAEERLEKSSTAWVEVTVVEVEVTTVETVEAAGGIVADKEGEETCLLYTSPSPRDKRQSRMPSSA